MIDWDEQAKQYYGKFQHPLEPTLSVEDYPQAVKLATASKFGGSEAGKGHATPKEAGAFWKEFKETGLSPDTYLQLLHTMAPMSFRYHGRAPTMREMVMHKEAKPKEMREWYSNLPHDQFPEMSAGDFITTMHKAKHFSQKHIGRDPYPHEVAYFHAGNHALDGIQAHYQELQDQRAQKSKGDQSDVGQH